MFSRGRQNEKASKNLTPAGASGQVRFWVRKRARGASIALPHPSLCASLEALQDALALPDAEAHAEARGKVLGEQPAIPSSGGHAAGCGALMDDSINGGRLLRRKPRRASARVMFAQAFRAVRVERVDPALDRARVFAEPARDFVAAAARRDEHDGMEPMGKSLLGRPAQFAGDQYADQLRTHGLESAHPHPP